VLKRTNEPSQSPCVARVERSRGYIRATYEIESLDTVDLNLPYTNNWEERAIKRKRALSEIRSSDLFSTTLKSHLTTLDHPFLPYSSSP
jgi:hypothetical protein